MTDNGSRVLVEHTADPNAPHPHFHAGQPQGDASETGVNFGWDTSRNGLDKNDPGFERYENMGGDHHYYYENP